MRPRIFPPLFEKYRRMIPATKTAANTARTTAMTQNHGESIMAAKRSLTFATVTPITISIMSRAAGNWASGAVDVLQKRPL